MIVGDSGWGLCGVNNNNNSGVVSQVIEFALKMWICQTAVVLIPVHLLMDSKSVHFLPILKYEPNGPFFSSRNSTFCSQTHLSTGPSPKVKSEGNG